MKTTQNVIFLILMVLVFPLFGSYVSAYVKVPIGNIYELCSDALTSLNTPCDVILYKKGDPPPVDDPQIKAIYDSLTKNSDFYTNSFTLNVLEVDQNVYVATSKGTFQSANLDEFDFPYPNTFTFMCDNTKHTCYPDLLVTHKYAHAITTSNFFIGGNDMAGAILEAYAYRAEQYLSPSDYASANRETELDKLPSDMFLNNMDCGIKSPKVNAGPIRMFFKILSGGSTAECKIIGIGDEKAYAIFTRAFKYLSDRSNFNDLYVRSIQACADLGYDKAICDSVELAGKVLKFDQMETGDTKIPFCVPKTGKAVSCTVDATPAPDATPTPDLIIPINTPAPVASVAPTACSQIEAPLIKITNTKQERFFQMQINLTNANYTQDSYQTSLFIDRNKDSIPDHDELFRTETVPGTHTISGLDYGHYIIKVKSICPNTKKTGSDTTTLNLAIFRNWDSNDRQRRQNSSDYTGTCVEYPKVAAPAGYCWKANCTEPKSCYISEYVPTYSNNCPKQTKEYTSIQEKGYPSNWCYGFSSTEQVQSSKSFRCMILTKDGCPSNSSGGMGQGVVTF
ncbi:MAG: hypothetical protein WCO06_07625 [Candidatus Roizmanbacteria bacterium]